MIHTVIGFVIYGDTLMTCQISFLPVSAYFGSTAWCRFCRSGRGVPVIIVPAGIIAQRGGK